MRIGKQYTLPSESIEVWRVRLRVAVKTPDPVIEIVNGDQQNVCLTINFLKKNVSLISPHRIQICGLQYSPLQRKQYRDTPHHLAMKHHITSPSNDYKQLKKNTAENDERLQLHFMFPTTVA